MSQSELSKQGTVSVRSAILRGQLGINLPVTIPLWGIPALVYLQTGGSSVYARFWWVSLLVGFVLGWIVWSFLTPKWRVWALQRVEDLPALQEAGVKALLIWPAGHFFEKTEIKTRSDRIAEQEAWLFYYLKQLQILSINSTDGVMNIALRLRDALGTGAAKSVTVSLAAELRDKLIELQQQRSSDPDYARQPQLVEDLLLTRLTSYIQLL